MTTFTIDNENAITAFATAEEAAAASTTPFDSFGNEQELAELASQWPDERRVAVWNSLPGVKPTEATQVKNRKKVLAGIWTRVQRLGESAPQTDGKPEPGATSESATAQPEAAPAPRKAKGAPAKAKATKKATAAKAAPETKTVAKDAKAKGARKAKESGEPKAARTGSKSEEVIAMLKRKGGATMAEIMSHTGWQKHTTRGWVSGFLGKKMGIAVESFKSDNGERTYRINQ